MGIGLVTGQGDVSLCYVLPEVQTTGAVKTMLQAMHKEAIRRRIHELTITSTYTGLQGARRVLKKRPMRLRLMHWIPALSGTRCPAF